MFSCCFEYAELGNGEFMIIPIWVVFGLMKDSVFIKKWGKSLVGFGLNGDLSFWYRL